MQRKITIGVGAGIGLISAALINLTSAYQPLLLGLLGMGIFIVCWETAPSIADRIRAEGPEKERKVLPIVIMAFGGVLFATGAIWYHVGHPALVKVTDVGPSGGPG